MLLISIAIIPRIEWNIWACPGRVLKISLSWPFWDISKNVLSQSILYPFSKLPKNVFSAGHVLVTSCTCPGRVLKMSLSWPFWDISKNVLSQSVLCPFFYFSNLSHVLAQNFLKMCPRPDMSRTRPERVPDVSSKCPCPDQFGTSPNRTSATKAAVPTPGDEDEGGRNKLTLPTSDHPGNQDSYSSVSEDYPEPPDHASPGKFCQCGVYGCLERDCTNWNGVYEPVDRAIVSEYSSKEDPEDFGFYWFIGGLFDSVGSDKNDETGDEGV